MAPEDLPLPQANQTLFKRYQSQKNLPNSGFDQKLRKKEPTDGAGTITTAPGTVSKADLNDL